MTDDEQQERDERNYIEGSRMAWRTILSETLRNLDEEGITELRIAQLVAQREDTRNALRRICADHGDNSWPDDLSLADVIDKYLAPYLEGE